MVRKSITIIIVASDVPDPKLTFPNMLLAVETGAGGVVVAGDVFQASIYDRPIDELACEMAVWKTRPWRLPGEAAKAIPLC
jgi:hypothetical protein